MKISGIYKIQSIKKPDRIYIGSSICISERWRDHKKELRRNNHSNRRLQNHFNKYGEKDLLFNVIVGCDKDNLISYEQFYIDSLYPFFNINKIASSRLGVKASEKTIKRLRLSHLGIRPSDETLIKRSKSLKGKIPWNKGIPCSEESKHKKSISLNGCWGMNAFAPLF